MAEKAKRSPVKVIGFRPYPELLPLLKRLEAIPHVRRTWVYNQALLVGLPAVLKKVNA